MSAGFEFAFIVSFPILEVKYVTAILEGRGKFGLMQFCQFSEQN